MTDMGLLILRLAIGLIVAAHGAQKLFAWFGGPGLDGWTAIIGQLGVRPAPFWARINALAEFLGGLMLAIGLFTPVAAAVLGAVMLMAIVSVHWRNGFFNTNRGIEFPLSLLAGMVTIGLAGPGAYALAPQSLLGWSLPTLFLVTSALGVLADGVALATAAISTDQRHTA
jgi:putative oxidoreductase